MIQAAVFSRASALVRSSRELLAVHGLIAVPGDIQKPVDAVCAGWDVDTAARDVQAHLDGERAMANAALPVMIPHPRDLVDLFDLTNSPMTDAEAATRYNLDTVTVLPVWARSDGRLALDPDGSLLLPELRHADLHPIRERLLSVRLQPWQKTLSDLAGRLPGWDGERRPGRVLILEHPCGEGELSVGGWTVSYDCRRGLVVQAPVAEERA
ncbi:hypothetical protein [Saccharothrix sp. ST-888]|uniref:hypothetical protein n=1 Tax=Saccharothrix sp. ST-888 TaxID=1427391 RepID=UPI0005ECED75|nr:hypothetical protein [Saccharothrix sp. ST-888]KJK55231.1 hypothetical protein UK12_29890 [Saccharothrix sp. ST-888]